MTRSTLEVMRLDVERRMRRGERFADVEAAIHESDLPSDEKHALWLLGWSYVHPRAQRRVANGLLMRLTAATHARTNGTGRFRRVAG
jgi:hypothetical protein